VIRLVLADDQTLVRQGIRGLLELAPDLEVVGEASDGDEAVRVVDQSRPDVLLLDVRMPRMSGLDALTALAGRRPPTILLTTFDDDHALIEGIRRGAKGFLLKDVPLEQLTAAIRTVAGGGTLYRPAITQRVLERLPAVRREFEGLDLPERLTPRETQVLRLLAGGYSNREIAGALATAEGTVKNQVSTILSKLGVRDRTRAVLRALELGWI
jgi:DNA-binding NarL/FixJ family response regulator